MALGAAFEAAMSVKLLALFSNAEATLPNCAVVPGILENTAIPGGVYDVAPGYAQRFTAASALVAELEVEDVITIAATDYRVIAIEPDGMGLTVLGLK